MSDRAEAGQSAIAAANGLKGFAAGLKGGVGFEVADMSFMETAPWGQPFEVFRLFEGDAAL